MSDFGYVNARLRSMRTRRISPKQFETFLGYREIREIEEWLGSSPYAAAYERASSDADGLKAVDAAVSEQLKETLQRCVKMVQTEGRSALSVYLARTDYENVKVVARAVQGGGGFASASPALVPMPSLDIGQLESLCEQEDLTGMARQLMTLGHPTGAALSRFLRTEVDGDTADLAAMDRALERAYYGNAISVLAEEENEEDEPLLEALKDEVDLSNLRTALKVAYAGGGEYGQVPLPHGRLKRAFLEKASAARDLTEALEWVGKSVFRKAVDQVARDAAAAGDIGRLERCLEQARVDRCAKGGIIDPTGIGFTLSFLAGAYLEAQNLRLAARAVAGLIPVSAAEEAMIYV